MTRCNKGVFCLIEYTSLTLTEVFRKAVYGGTELFIVFIVSVAITIDFSKPNTYLSNFSHNGGKVCIDVHVYKHFVVSYFMYLRS